MPSQAQRRGRGGPPPAPQPLHFQFTGPSSGGRIASISGVPGDTATWYVGNASGGVWKSVDSGGTWLPVFDKQPVQAIGALAVAPSAPNMVWAGTGEAWAIRDADLQGDGIYLSTDSGATWTNMGLRETGRIGRIVNRGCSGLEYVAIARGEAHFALHTRSLPWDHAAGMLIVKEAGGAAAFLDGSPYDPRIPNRALLAAIDAESWAAVRDLVEKPV